MRLKRSIVKQQVHFLRLFTAYASSNSARKSRERKKSDTMKKPNPCQCWNIVNWTLRNKLQWNFNRNSYIFIQENAFENVVWKMAAILSRPQCVKFFLLRVAWVMCSLISSSNTCYFIGQKCTSFWLMWKESLGVGFVQVVIRKGIQ